MRRVRAPLTDRASAVVPTAPLTGRVPPAAPSTERSHFFQVYSFTEPTWCARCQAFLWGLTDQGYRCSACFESRCSGCRLVSDGCPGRLPEFAPAPRTKLATFSIDLPAFSTLLEAFEYCQPNKSGFITDHVRFAAVAAILANDRADQEVVWSHLDQDGNGAVSFPEFVEWAEANDVLLPTGVGGGDVGVAFPRTWTGPRSDPTWNRRQDITDRALLTELQELLDITYKRKSTRDRRSHGGVPKRYRLLRAQRSENYQDWRGRHEKICVNIFTCA